METEFDQLRENFMSGQMALMNDIVLIGQIAMIAGLGALVLLLIAATFLPDHDEPSPDRGLAVKLKPLFVPQRQRSRVALAVLRAVMLIGCLIAAAHA